MNSGTLYNSKILLFGEYGIIENTMGLSIPYEEFKGHFIFEPVEETEEQSSSNTELKKFVNYLEKLVKAGELSCDLGIKALKKDIERGMFFSSSVPSGFGVGSSGTVVAAIYGKYCQNKIDVSDDIAPDDILKLKNIFSEMESYFHGRSSGLDPLICYLNIPLLIKSQTELDKVGLPKYNSGQGAVFLLDTGQIGKTEPLVQYFLNRCKEEGFRNMIKRRLKKYNDAAIEAFLNNDINPLMHNVKHLSELLFAHFKPMIPDVFHQLWQEGIDSNAYYLKLCGSGGGGFILGFTHDFEAAKEKLGNYELRRLYSF